MKSLVVLISGRGSNLRALLDARLPVRFAGVISDRPQAGGLDIARRHGVPTAVVEHRAFASREAFEAALEQEIARHGPDLIALAGFMRILSGGLTRRFDGRMLNIHPSLLPAFTGLHTHRRALEEGVRIHGCTVHFVTPELDAGPIVCQAAVPVLTGDDEESLAARVLAEEHRIYPQAVRWFAEDRLMLDERRRVVVRSTPEPGGTLHVPALDAAFPDEDKTGQPV